MSSETDRGSDGGYVHRPEGYDGTASEAETDAEDGFGGKGWALVAVIALTFLVVPGIIYLFPSIPPSFGLPYLTSFLVLPMIPALLLGLTAVWSMTAAKGK